MELRRQILSTSSATNQSHISSSQLTITKRLLKPYQCTIGILTFLLIMKANTTDYGLHRADTSVTHTMFQGKSIFSKDYNYSVHIQIYRLLYKIPQVETMFFIN